MEWLNYTIVESLQRAIEISRKGEVRFHPINNSKPTSWRLVLEDNQLAIEFQDASRAILQPDDAPDDAPDGRIESRRCYIENSIFHLRFFRHPDYPVVCQLSVLKELRKLTSFLFGNQRERLPDAVLHFISPSFVASLIAVEFPDQKRLFTTGETTLFYLLLLASENVNVIDSSEYSQSLKNYIGKNIPVQIKNQDACLLIRIPNNEEFHFLFNGYLHIY